MDPADAELLRRYAHDGSEAAFAELVRRHLPLVYGAALRQLGGAAHRAEDVTQTVFLDLARKAAELSRRTEIVGWLYTGTHFAAAKLKRGEQRRQLREQEAQIMNERVSNAPEADWDQLRPVLDDAMLELSEPEREIILLRFFQGQRFAEVGRKLQLSEDAARMRGERALDKLRAVLARGGITSTSAALATLLTSHPCVAAPVGVAAAVTANALATWSAATATTAATAGIFHLMAASKTSLVVGGVATLLIAGAAGWAWHNAHQIKPATPPAPPPAVAEVVPPPPTPPPAVAAAPVVATPEPAAAAPVSLGPIAIIEDLNQTVRTPPRPVTAVELPIEPRAALMEKAKARLDTSYGTLFEKLNLSGTQLAEFKELLVQKQKIKTEANNLASATRKDDSATYHEEIGASQEAINARIKALLGEESFERYRDYEAGYVKRMTVSLLQATLRETQPLTPDQVDELVRTLVKNARSPKHRGDTGLTLNQAAGVSSAPTGGIDLTTVEEARDFLTPTQLQALKELRAKIRYQKGARELEAMGVPLP